MRLPDAQRLWIALGILALTAALARATMESGRIRDVVLVVLGGFGLRIGLAARAKPGRVDNDARDAPED